MPKYLIYASETVYYTKEVEADSYEQVNKMIQDGSVDLCFEYGDIVDGDNFQINSVEEAKRYA